MLLPRLTVGASFLLFSFQKNKKSTNNFDSEFTHEKVALTPCDANFIKKINQSEFAGFSYFNEEEFLRR